MLAPGTAHTERLPISDRSRPARHSVTAPGPPPELGSGRPVGHGRPDPTPTRPRAPDGASDQNFGYRTEGTPSKVTVTNSHQEVTVTRASLREYAAVQRERYLTDNIVHEGHALTIERLGTVQATENGHTLPRTVTARRPRGVGRVYQPEYKDKKTGERRTVATWWIQYSHHGEVVPRVLPLHVAPGRGPPPEETTRRDRPRQARRAEGREGHLRGSGQSISSAPTRSTSVPRPTRSGARFFPMAGSTSRSSAAGSATSTTPSVGIGRSTSPPTASGPTRTLGGRPAPRPRA